MKDNFEFNRIIKQLLIFVLKDKNECFGFVLICSKLYKR